MKAASILLVYSSIFLSVSGLLHSRSITVTTGSDEFHTPSGSRISLREAIRDLGEGSGTICLAESVLEVTLDRELTLGASAGLTVIDAAGFGGRPIRIVPGASFRDASLIAVTDRRVQLRNAILRRAESIAPDRLDWAIDARGGADVRIENCELAQWTSESRSAAAVRCLEGSEVTVVDCEFRDNKMGIRAVASPDRLAVENSLFCFHHEGALLLTINAESQVLIRNSTFAENLSPSAVVALSGTTGADRVAVNHCTFVDNVAPAFSGPPLVGIDYSLFARNIPATGDGSSVSIVESGPFGASSGGYNLADDAPASLDAASDMTGLAVKVSRLGDFGGARYCCFPLVGSRAIDGGDPNRQTVLPAVDVRGFARKARSFGAGTFTNLVDIGAVETNPEGTLVVSNTFNSGSGSLREAVGKATGETAHIVFQTPITSRIVVLHTPIVFDADRNYAIDATLRSYQFTAEDDKGPLFDIDGGPAAPGRPEVSFLGMNVEDFTVDTSTERGAIRVLSGKLCLHRCRFEANRAEEAGLVEGDRGELFLNECSFVDNVQSGGSAVDTLGGVALHLKNTPATIWNSSFIRNKTEARNGAVGFEGGAVRIENPGPAVFRQCTFARNEVGGPGAAIHFGDYSSTVSPGLTLDRCTIVGNKNTSAINPAKGAVSFANRSFVEVSASLFSHNCNQSNLIATNDLFGMQGEGQVSVITRCLNWTNWSEAFPGLVAPENLSTQLLFAPPTIWGDRIPTMPLLEGYGLETHCDFPERLYPRDAVNRIGFGGPMNLPTPGAVQRTLPRSEVLDYSILRMTSDELTVRVRGRFGIEWCIEGSTDLETFSPTGLTYSGAFIARSINIPIPQPRPDAWFIRFREKTE